VRLGKKIEQYIKMLNSHFCFLLDEIMLNTRIVILINNNEMFMKLNDVFTTTVGLTGLSLQPVLSFTRFAFSPS
jgi:hypothetical protein